MTTKWTMFSALRFSPVFLFISLQALPRVQDCNSHLLGLSNAERAHHQVTDNEIAHFRLLYTILPRSSNQSQS